jgi:hypothetical protein
MKTKKVSIKKGDRVRVTFFSGDKWDGELVKYGKKRSLVLLDHMAYPMEYYTSNIKKLVKRSTKNKKKDTLTTG